MQTTDPQILLKWYQFVYFKQGISSTEFKKEKMSDILLNISIQEAMMGKDKRLQTIEEMKRKAMS